MEHTGGAALAGAEACFEGGTAAEDRELGAGERAESTAGREARSTVGTRESAGEDTFPGASGSDATAAAEAVGDEAVRAREPDRGAAFGGAPARRTTAAASTSAVKAAAASASPLRPPELATAPLRTSGAPPLPPDAVSSRGVARSAGSPCAGIGLA